MIALVFFWVIMTVATALWIWYMINDDKFSPVDLFFFLIWGWFVLRVYFEFFGK